MEEKILLSLIVPVYNAEKYLSDCLDSLINYGNIEIICVNDGSTDNSKNILEKYAKEHRNIKVINKNNEGAAKARNLALKNTSGDYIGFVDSDDWIEKDLIPQLFEKIKTNPDIIIFGAKTLNEKTKRLTKGQYSSKFFKEKFKQKNLFSYHTVVWNKIYKNDFIKKNNINFSLLKTSEDQLFSIKSFILAKNIEIIKKDLYIYRKNNINSLTGTKKKKDLSPILSAYEIQSFIENEIDEKLYKKILGRYLLKATSWYAKTDKEYSSTYFVELENLYHFIKKKNYKFWWNFYKLRKNDPYLFLKIEYLKSLFLYFIKEKLKFLTTLPLFSVYTLQERLKND